MQAVSDDGEDEEDVDDEEEVVVFWLPYHQAIELVNEEVDDGDNEIDDDYDDR